MLIKKYTDNMNQTESKKYGHVPNYIKENLYRTKNSGLYLTLSELKNQNRLRKDSINSIKTL